MEFAEVLLDFGVDDGLVVGDLGIENDAEGVDGFLMEGIVFLFGDGAEEGDVQFGVAVEHVGIPDFFDFGGDFGVEEEGADAAILFVGEEVGGVLGEFDLLFDIAGGEHVEEGDGGLVVGDGVVDEDVVEFFGEDFGVHAPGGWSGRGVGIGGVTGEAWGGVGEGGGGTGEGGEIVGGVDDGGFDGVFGRDGFGFAGGTGACGPPGDGEDGAEDDDSEEDADEDFHGRMAGEMGFLRMGWVAERQPNSKGWRCTRCSSRRAILQSWHVIRVVPSPHDESLRELRCHRSGWRCWKSWRNHRERR